MSPLQVNRIYKIDALAGLKKLADESIDCVVTSPPYWSMRDYGVSPTKWSDGSKCALGLERYLEEYIDHLLEVFEAVYRVLKPSGTLWVNLADTYSGSYSNYCNYVNERNAQNGKAISGKGSSLSRKGRLDCKIRPPPSLGQSVRRKSLCLIPERFALGMLKRGWTLRNRIVWHKPNHLPSPVKDRFTNSWEYLFFFVKNRKYAFNLDAVRVPHKTIYRLSGKRKYTVKERPSPDLRGRRLPPHPGEPQSMHPNGKNPGDYWSISPETRSHETLLGQNRAKRNARVHDSIDYFPGGGARKIRERDPRWLSPKGKNPGDAWMISTKPFRGAHFAVYPEKLCEVPIKSGCPTGGIVLDPFIGSGTTAIVAKRLGRKYIGLEMNPDYVKIARTRIANSG